MRLDRTLAALLLPRCAACGQLSPRALCAPCFEERSGPGALLTTPAGHAVVSLGRYHGPLGRHVRALKYGESPLWAARLGAAMKHLIPPEQGHAPLVPVPLHPSRLVERGYNQSALIARALGSVTGQATHTHLLERTRKTEAQARLDAQARDLNVKDAFQVTASAPAPHGVFLVDDVVTTGRTIDSCASALEAGGFRVLACLCCALGGSGPQAPESQNTVKASPPSSRSAGRDSVIHE